MNPWSGLCPELHPCPAFLRMVCVTVCERRAMVWGSLLQLLMRCAVVRTFTFACFSILPTIFTLSSLCTTPLELCLGARLDVLQLLTALKATFEAHSHRPSSKHSLHTNYGFHGSQRFGGLSADQMSSHQSLKPHQPFQSQGDGKKALLDRGGCCFLFFYFFLFAGIFFVF